MYCYLTETGAAVWSSAMVCYTVMSNVGTLTGSIIQVVLHDKAMSSPEEAHRLESAKQAECEATGPSHEEDAQQSEPSHEKEDAQLSAQEEESPRPPVCGIVGLKENPPFHSLLPALHTSSLGSTDMEISSNDQSLEAGRTL